jgi:hypothetical protein
MKFMETPTPGLEENRKMTDSQIQIAVAFVTEFISVGVLALVTHGILLVNACPFSLWRGQDSNINGYALQI